MAEEELKGLSPEERIRKLKELEKKKKKEIEEAHRMLKESEKELTEQEEWRRKVPIPQVAAERTEGMSEAEKEIIRAHKGLRGEREEAVEEGEEAPPTTPSTRPGEEGLEEAVARERVEAPEEAMEREYVIKKSQEPIENLYQELRGIREEVEERGYVSREAAERVREGLAGLGKKVEDLETGRYSLTDEVAEAGLLSRSVAMGADILSDYRRRRERQGDLYQR